MSEWFTEDEARAKIGTRIRTRVEFSGVRAGMVGTVIRHYASGRGRALDIAWEIPGRSALLVDGFSKDEYQQFLMELG
jgi:hypothetical protein